MSVETEYAKPEFMKCWCIDANGVPVDQEELDYDPEEEFYGGVPIDSDGVDWGFSDSGGVSALRAATHDFCPRHECHRQIDETDSFCRNCGQTLNPRKFPCPTCGTPNVLTQADVNHRYQCDRCADAVERGMDI
jgi:hypothetical protein